MHGHGRASANQRPHQRPRHALFVERVAAFVNRAEQRGREQVWIQARRDAHVVWGKIRGERVRRCVLPPALEIKPHLAQHVKAELPLPRRVECLLKHRIAHGVAAFDNALNQADDRSFQGSENPLDVGGFHFRLITIQQRIVNMVNIAEIFGFAAR